MSRQNPSSMDSLEEYEARFREEMRNCPTCQIYDGGEIVWVHGNRVFIEYLFDWLEIPEEARDELVERVDCPFCGAGLSRRMDVGIRFDFERAHDRRLEEAWDRYEDRLWDFVHHLEEYPFLGASHEVGRQIYEEVDDFPTTVIENQVWHRARSVRSGQKFSSQDLVPPDPDNVQIPAGRYNHPGRAQWYLASEPEAAVAEVTGKNEQIAWVQDFRIGRLENILDLRSWTPRDRRAFDEKGELKEFPLIAIALVFSDTLTQRSDTESPGPCPGTSPPGSWRTQLG